jgi:uncharacterized protein YjbI with pentapeptide repeats
MPYNVLMPEEEEHRSLRPGWLLVWQRRWWIALATLFLLVWWLVPPWLYRHTGTTKDAKLKAITDTRTALLAGLIGVGALLAFWLNSRVYRITARTFELTEQGQITERYTKAIEQLGQKELAMRLGGIYALERIAKDSERDHPTVVEVLSAFVREESRRQGAGRPEQGMAQEAAKEIDTAAPERNAEVRPATDVQAALTVLGRLPQRAGISRGDLSEAHLSGVQLERAELSGVQLRGADLSRAKLLLANLSGAVLQEADLSGADLLLANLSGAMLLQANLSGAHLERANLSGAMLLQANLSGAHLERANLSGAMLIGADLSGAPLRGVNLSGADLQEADLSDAPLNGADLSEADLSETLGLRQPQLNTAHGDAKTQLPYGLRRPTRWTTDDDSATAGS